MGPWEALPGGWRVAGKLELNGLSGPFQPKSFYDAMILIETLFNLRSQTFCCVVQTSLSNVCKCCTRAALSEESVLWYSLTCVS